MTPAIRTAIRVEGIVQGVGFRPFVYTLATGLGLSGLVGNDADGVFVEVEGPAADVRRFVAALERDAPPLARIERMVATAIAPTGSASFAIAASPAGGDRRTPVAADTATCTDCLRELWDPADRRYGYPFHQLHQLRPGVTIVRDVPYNRRRRPWRSSPCANDVPPSTRTPPTAGSTRSRPAVRPAARAGDDQRPCPRKKGAGAVPRRRGVPGLRAGNCLRNDELRSRGGRGLRRRPPLEPWQVDVVGDQEFAHSALIDFEAGAHGQAWP